MFIFRFIVKCKQQELLSSQSNFYWSHLSTNGIVLFLFSGLVISLHLRALTRVLMYLCLPQTWSVRYVPPCISYVYIFYIIFISNILLEPLFPSFQSSFIKWGNLSTQLKLRYFTVFILISYMISIDIQHNLLIINDLITIIINLDFSPYNYVVIVIL